MSMWFQFQLGAIGRKMGEAAQAVLPKFQFQLGAIGRVLNLIQMVQLFIVSIPAWCDWEMNKN